jgi:cytochrome d ubiquinol oxidase subunit II
MDLNTIWFFLIGVLIAGYAVLDGFDLGVGVLHLFARDEEERGKHVAAIGPVWDGNEVWLLTGGGALFAAFPVVYATVFSGFYLALMLLLVALIARAVALEFRNAVASPRWARAWDWAFGLGSLVPALLFGVAVGNVLRGVPIGPGAAWQGSFLGLLNPYSILVGLVSLVFFVMHGALYLRMKTDGPLADRLGAWAFRAWTVFVLLYGLATLATRLVSPFLFDGAGANPLFWLLTAVLVAAIFTTAAATRRVRSGLAFLASSATIVTMILLAAVNMYPRLVPARPDLANSLTIYNASSSPLTLKTMLVIALIGMPFVLGYTIVIYRVFKGKVQVESGAYGAELEARAAR